MACDARPGVRRQAPSHFRRAVAGSSRSAPRSPAIVLLRQHKFDHGNLPLLIGLLVVIAVFAIAGSLMWKAANKHDPASKAEPVKFFVQNQLGAIITVLAFLPLIVLIFMDKDMDPKNKKIAGGIGVVLAARRDVDRDRLQPAVGRAIHAGHEQVRGRDQSQPADHRLFARGRRTGARTSPGIRRRWPTRRRAPRTRTALMSSTGSLRRTAPRRRRRRMSSTSARA